MSEPVAPARSLADDAFVMLDPAVEVSSVEVHECALLIQTELGMGMAVPAGEGLLEFVRGLVDEPVRVGALREDYDDDALIDEMLASLLGRGFAHVTGRERPTTAALTQLRAEAARRLARAQRRPVVLDLDVVSLERACAQWNAGETAAEVLLHCSRVSDHARGLAELARRRRAGELRAHHVVVRTLDVRCEAATREALARLGAAVELEDVAWPAPAAVIPGLAELSQQRIATHVSMRPDASILAAPARERCIEWVRAQLVAGLCLRLESEAIWGAAPVEDAERERLMEAVRELEIAIGDVVVSNMPSDEVLLGNCAAMPPREAPTAAARSLRLAYLRWRIPQVMAFEGTCPWAQSPEHEDKWVRAADDLLPNHPELLGLVPGHTVVDFCGGLGRVARRLGPAVGAQGTIISIEMRRFLSERARRFAYERRLVNLEFRPGLAQRVPLPDASVDAAVNEWTGAIWELGLGPAMVAEMTRVVRPGGRIAVTHRLVQLHLDALAEPRVQYDQIYAWVREAFRRPELKLVAERVWGQTVPSLGGERASDWVEQFMPRLVNPNDWTYTVPASEPPRADVYLTMVAERR